MLRDVDFYFVGGSPTEEYLRLQQENHLKNVHFIGFCDKEKLKEYYQASDIFVLPTREDIWGLVINEAMANGLPVITTDRCVAGLELVRDGENGYIVPVGDVDVTTDAIQKVFQGDIEQMGLKSLETAQRYTIEAMADAHMRVFNDV